MKDDKSRKRSLICLALVLLCATGYYFFIAQGAPVMSFSKETGKFAFAGSRNTSVQFSFDQLEKLELYSGDSPDWGRAVSGGEVLGGHHWGTWTSDTVGTYEAFVTERIHHYILVSDGEKTAVFNTSNNETTDSLYEQMLAYQNGELNK